MQLHRHLLRSVAAAAQVSQGEKSPGIDAPGVIGTTDRDGVAIPLDLNPRHLDAAIGNGADVSGQQDLFVHRSNTYFVFHSRNVCTD